MTPEEYEAYKKQKRAEYMREYRKTHVRGQTERTNRHRRHLKERIFEALGAKCACCGESEQVFLCVDHVNGGGNEHRTKRKNSQALIYRDVLRDIKDGGSSYRILCFNCNQAFSILGYCPHHPPQEESK